MPSGYKAQKLRQLTYRKKTEEEHTEHMKTNRLFIIECEEREQRKMTHQKSEICLNSSFTYSTKFENLNQTHKRFDLIIPKINPF